MQTIGLQSIIVEENPHTGILWFSEEYPEITFVKEALK